MAKKKKSYTKLGHRQYERAKFQARMSGYYNGLREGEAKYNELYNIVKKLSKSLNSYQVLAAINAGIDVKVEVSAKDIVDLVNYF